MADWTHKVRLARLCSPFFVVNETYAVVMSPGSIKARENKQNIKSLAGSCFYTVVVILIKRISANSLEREKKKRIFFFFRQVEAFPASQNEVVMEKKKGALQRGIVVLCSPFCTKKSRLDIAHLKSQILFFPKNKIRVICSAHCPLPIKHGKLKRTKKFKKDSIDKIYQSKC